MTLIQLLTLAANRLDDTKEPYLWSDEELTSYANQRINELCSTIPILVDVSTLSITSIPIVSGIKTYALSPLIVYIKEAILALSSLPLNRITLSELRSFQPAWKTVANTPVVFMTDVAVDTITLYPTPIVNDTLSLEVVRYPLVPLDYTLAEVTTPEIPARFHELLIPGMTSLAYKKADAETESLARSKADELEWLTNIEKIKKFYLNFNYSPALAVPNYAFM